MKQQASSQQRSFPAEGDHPGRRISSAHSAHPLRPSTPLARSSTLLLDGPADCVLHELIGILEAELPLDLLAIRFHGLLLHVHSRGNLYRGQPPAQQFENLEFAVGERGECRLLC